MKTIVFDLDETLGYFTHLHELWNYIFNAKRIWTLMQKKQTFLALMKLYPEFIRPGIVALLKTLYVSYIQPKKCSKLYLYTNNQCCFEEWIDLIIFFFETEISGKLFAKPIRAFKINGHSVEPLRTTSAKTFEDLIACTRLPENVDICFVDDKYHEKMVHCNVLYIQPPPYRHHLSYAEMHRRFVNSTLLTDLRHSPFSHRIGKSKKDSVHHIEIELRITQNLSVLIFGYLQQEKNGSLTKHRRRAPNIGQFTKRKK